MKWGLDKGNIVTSSNGLVKQGQITIENNTIQDISHKTDSFLDININVENLWIFPGLINSHDHLLGSYFPRVGSRKPYLNWLMWDNDLKSSPVYIERQQIDARYIYILGAYKNLISGFTSVQDHIPHFVRKKFASSFPIRLIDKYALAHCVCSFALPWGDGIVEEHQKAQKENTPFITHCSEGFDEETRHSVRTLKQLNALTQHSVLIHGIAFSDKDILDIKEANANVVWCPFSNLYMFEKTAPIKKLLETGINVSLGTDSPMSGSINIFEEIQVAKSFYRNAYNEELDNQLLYRMLIENPIKSFFLKNTGYLEKNNLADILIIKGEVNSPYDALANMNYNKIALVIVDGIPRFADRNFEPLFKALNVPYQHVLVDNSYKIIYGNIIRILDEVKKSVGYDKKLDFLPVSPAV